MNALFRLAAVLVVSGPLCAQTTAPAPSAAAEPRPPAGPDVHTFAAVKPYKPVPALAGQIDVVGSDELEKLTERWIAGFRALYPDVKFTLEAKSSLAVGPALNEGRSQVGPLGREFLQPEEDAFVQKHGYPTLDIRIAGGAWAVKGRTHEVAYMVNQANPLDHIDFQKLDAVLSTTRKRGYPTDITTWGQLGLTGEWADKPIHLWGLITADGITHLVQTRVLQGGEFKTTIEQQKSAPDKPAIDAIVEHIAADKYALGVGGLGYVAGQPVKTLALAEKPGGPYLRGTYGEILNHRYPLSRYVFIHLGRAPGKPLEPRVREFVRYALGAEGQRDVVEEGSYLPLTPDVVREELKKLQ